MNNAIIVEYNPFDAQSRVFIRKEDSRENVSIFSDITNLTIGLINLAYQYNIYEIKIHGPFAIASEIRKEINKNEKDLYSQNKITVEGI